MVCIYISMSRLYSLFQETDPIEELKVEIGKIDKEIPMDISIDYAGINGDDEGRVVISDPDGNPLMLVDFVTSKDKWFISDCRDQTEVFTVKDIHKFDYDKVAEEIVNYLQFDR